jgi:23S rRNA (cytidine1920-2'-O)/16S rRNA (cytidine1409-2'-O)-methyltransferase
MSAALVRLPPSLGQQSMRRKEEAVAGRGRVRLRKLTDEVARTHPAIEDPEAAISSGLVLVGGRLVTNPASLVRAGVAVTLRKELRPRGQAKLESALAAFAIDVGGRVALDVGAAAGGFTRALLAAGARRVYAVDAGFGQLTGSIRQDERVVNLERTNLGELHTGLVADEIELVTVDLSYLALAEAVPQLARLRLAARCELVALVKPQFELGLPTPPRDEHRLGQAQARAAAGVRAAGWAVIGSIRSQHPGGRGAVEFFIYARKEQ